MFKKSSTTVKPDNAPRRPLPKPEPLNASLQHSLTHRKTSYEFSDLPISDRHLASILWAADGKTDPNPKDNHRTTPTTLNWREIEIYVVKANGVWKWCPETQDLAFVQEHDHRKDVCYIQAFCSKAPVHLVYVYNETKTQGLINDLVEGVLKVTKSKELDEIREEVLKKAPLLDTGAKVMAVYLAAAALDINCMSRITMDENKVRKALKLNEHQTPLCIQTLAYKPTSLFDLAL